MPITSPSFVPRHTTGLAALCLLLTLAVIPARADTALAKLSLSNFQLPVTDQERDNTPYDDAHPMPSRLVFPQQAWRLVTGQIRHDRVLSLAYGTSYSEHPKIDYALVTRQNIYNYEEVWLHNVPHQLKFKTELSAGARIKVDPRFVASASIFAMWFPDCLATAHLKPYLEGGIGIIYTDFQTPGQGLRFNFNPQAGIGTMIQTTADSEPWLIALRLHHLSNAGLNHDNNGVNAILIMVGRCF